MVPGKVERLPGFHSGVLVLSTGYGRGRQRHEQKQQQRATGETKGGFHKSPFTNVAQAVSLRLRYQNVSQVNNLRYIYPKMLRTLSTSFLSSKSGVSILANC